MAASHGRPIQRIPPLLPSAPAAHQVAGQSHQHRGPRERWLIEHAITAHSATPPMARPSNTEIHGSNVSKRGFQRRNQTLESRLHARERRGKNTQPLGAIPQGTSAPPATETSTPGSGYTVIQDPAEIPRLTIASSRQGCHYYYYCYYKYQ